MNRRFIHAAGLAALVLLSGGDAFAKGRHHRGHASPVRHGHAHHAPGAHCRIGLFFRPSSGACSHSPYRVAGGLRRHGRVAPIHARHAFHRIRHAFRPAHHASMTDSPSPSRPPIAGAVAAVGAGVNAIIRNPLSPPAWAGTLNRTIKFQ